MSKLSLKTEGETHVVVTRHFAAPPELVYRAHIEASLIQQWMLGPDGWTMPVCINDARVGGKIRYEWADGNGNGFYLTGEFLELQPFRRMWNACTCLMRHPTITSRLDSNPMLAAR
jgi:uncharacterized protein YndB with AHSA1/START domain